jgi:inner membrane protein
MKWSQLKPFIGIALACLLLHMVLDSIAAEIGWLKPFAPYEVNLVQVPARYDWWVWSFVLHWTFLLELAIVLAAGVTLWRATRAGHPSHLKNP